MAIYCRSGTMSAAAAPVLAELGYDDIVELDGGMVAWTASGDRCSSRTAEVPVPAQVLSGRS